MKKIQTQVLTKKLGSSGLELLVQNPKQLKKISVFIAYRQSGRQGYYILLNRESGLLHTAKQGGGVITYSQTGRQGYYIQLNQEAELLHRAERGDMVN